MNRSTATSVASTVDRLGANGRQASWSIGQETNSVEGSLGDPKRLSPPPAECELEEIGLAGRGVRKRNSEIIPSAAGGNPPARGAIQETFEDQVGLDDIFEGASIFSNSSRESFDTGRSTVEFFQQGSHQQAIETVETAVVDVESFESVSRTLPIDRATLPCLHFGEIANATQKSVGNPWRTPGAPPNLTRGVRLDLDP
jgi:hypothetical protein